MVIASEAGPLCVYLRLVVSGSLVLVQSGCKRPQGLLWRSNVFLPIFSWDPLVMASVDGVFPVAHWWIQSSRHKLVWSCWLVPWILFTYWNDWSAVFVKDGWFPDALRNASVVRLVQVFLNGKRYCSWFAESWCDIRFEIDFKVIVFQASKFLYPQVREFFADL